MIDRIIVILALAFSIFILFFTDYGNSSTRVYNCDIAEISPDFPPEVREECRRLRKEQHNQYHKENSKNTIII